MSTSSKPLSRDAVEHELRSLPEWSMHSAGSIARRFRFDDYPSVINFVTKVADVAERLQHHPDMQVRHGSVEVRFITFDAGGITKKDIAAAREVDALVTHRPAK